MKSLIETCFFVLLYFVSELDCNAQAYNAHDSLDINNIGARINVLGDNFGDPVNGISKFDAPINTNMHTIYVSALWIGGYENGKLKEAAMTYRQSGIDFYPGPLDTTSDSISSTEMNNWDHVWKVKRSEINDFLKNGTLYSSISNWPGNGNAQYHEAHIMAPYVDTKVSQNYDPSHGDYPDMKGDEMIWWVMNDKGGPHYESTGQPLGIEVRGEAYAFNMPSNPAINNTIFLDYKIINRSGTDIDSAYLSLYTDFDIGYPFDDYVGSAPKLSAYYGYNGEPTDQVYGSNTPVESVIFLKDSMSRFLYYNNNVSLINGNPGLPDPDAQDYYNYMKGVWKNGACMKYGSSDGVSGTQCTEFMFDGSPADTVSGWTERNVGNIPGDRRGIGSVGPITLKAGQVYDLPVAYVFSRQTNGNTAVNFDSTVQYWNQVKAFYNSNYTITGINSPASQQTSLKIYPNPATTSINVQSIKGTPQQILMLDMTGRIVYSEISPKNDGSQIIDISKFSNGVYTILAKTREGVSSQKLVITR